MAELVALALPGGPDFVTALRRVWATGDAVFPVDHRLPSDELRRVMEVIAPGSVIESDGERRTLDGGRPVEEGDAAVLATSGTTGLPKGVVHTHDGLRASALATFAALDINPATDKWLACLPLAHVSGFSVVTRSLLTDTPVEIHSGFDPAAVSDAARRGVSLVSLVTKALHEIDPSIFRQILLGGGRPPVDRPPNTIATYGLTETGSGVVYDRKPLDGVEIRINDEGEIHLRAPMLLRCYRDATAPELHRDPRASDGWFATEDLGGWNDDNSLRVDGRRGDVVVTGGEKVWPERAEAVLNNQPNVVEAAVIGRPHPEWGQEVVACVVPADGATPDLAQLREAVRAKLPVWYAPRVLEICDALPRTALGKLRRGDLR